MSSSPLDHSSQSGDPKISEYTPIEEAILKEQGDGNRIETSYIGLLLLHLLYEWDYGDIGEAEDNIYT